MVVPPDFGEECSTLKPDFDFKFVGGVTRLIIEDECEITQSGDSGETRSIISAMGNFGEGVLKYSRVGILSFFEPLTGETRLITSVTRNRGDGVLRHISGISSFIEWRVNWAGGSFGEMETERLRAC